ncbi:MAG TPA: glycogen-binding domain-containing protein [Gemmatimonadaceae bacterium]|nr:glycogen-binding domain-containing protein [Gemmatimonadaceae bacterium]
MPHLYPHALMALAAGAVLCAPVHAQYAAGANIGASVVPLAMGPVRVSADAGVGRNISWTAPRTVLSLGTTAMIGGDARGAALAFFAQRSVEADSTGPVFALRATAWHSLGPVTLRLGLAEHALRFAGVPGSISITPLDTMLLTDSGYVPYHGPTMDTVVHPGTPSHVQLWSELEAGADWALGRLRLNALVGARPPVAGFRAATWAQAGATIDVLRGVGLDVSAGTSPARIGLGIPGSRFVSLGIRVEPGLPSPEVSVRHTTPAASFAVRADGPDRYTVTYVSSQAGSVQLAGDFNAWTPIDLTEDGRGRWRATIALAPGVHHVSLRVDGGPWFAPPGTPSVADEFGGTSGLLDVR